jgi:hypothetical protein
MFRRPSTRNRAERMRFAVDAMPRFAREAMLRGIDDNEIIAGAYVDSRSGGVCPMLAAHRNGGRTDLASFARSWDRFTGANGPRPATEREIRALRGYLEMSLVADVTGEESLASAAELRRRSRWSWLRPTRRYDVYRERLAAASEQLAEQRAAEILDGGPATTAAEHTAAEHARSN